jgi:hypothetical protein
MPWTDIGGGYHWGDQPGWADAAPAPEPAPLPPLPKYIAPAVAPVAPWTPPAPAAPAPPVEAIGPSISPGGPIVSKLQTGAQPVSTGAVLAGTLLPPASIWSNPVQKSATSTGSISLTK